MSQVDELHNKYPNVPGDHIIKWEDSRHGTKYTETVDRVSYYDRGDLYQSRDNDVSLKDLAKQKPWTVKPGFVLRTKCMYLKSGFSARAVRDTESPYEIREEGLDKYALYEGEERIEDAYFPYPKHWREEPEKEPRTSKGTPVTSLVGLNRRCFNVTAVRHCQYFDTGEQCRFCNVNATQADARVVGATTPLMLNLEETVEAYKVITAQMPPLVEGCIIMGGLASSELEAKVHLQFVENLTKATPYLPHISPSVETMSKKNMQRLKDAGAQYDMYNRMDRLMWCPLDRLSNGYGGQLGMIEMCGDLGKWADTFIPEDANWIGKFIESFKVPAETS